MTEKDIESRLMAARDANYAEFTARIVPTVSPETIVGVRLPQLRHMAKELQKAPSSALFLQRLPHRYYEENLLHALMLNSERDLPLLMEKLEEFLPHVDNWAVCDSLRPKSFARHRGELYSAVPGWLSSAHEYTVRFGLGMLMAHFLDEDFDEDALRLAASVKREEYYIRMMQAWLFATALAKQYEHALPYLEERRLSPEVISMTVRKCLDSFRISDERKKYIKTLK